MEKTKLGPQTLLFPMPAVLVGAQVNETANFMTAAWCGIAASTPPALTVALRPARFTLAGVQATGTFSINVPSADMAKVVDYCGIYPNVATKGYTPATGKINQVCFRWITAFCKPRR